MRDVGQFRIRDEQAIFVEDGSYRIIGDKE
jgi:hypothetical protein